MANRWLEVEKSLHNTRSGPLAVPAAGVPGEGGSHRPAPAQARHGDSPLELQGREDHGHGGGCHGRRAHPRLQHDANGYEDTWPRGDDTQAVAQGRQRGGPSLAAYLMLSSSGQLRSPPLGAGHGPMDLRQADSELDSGGTVEGTESPTCPDLPGTVQRWHH